MLMLWKFGKMSFLEEQGRLEDQGRWIIMDHPRTLEIWKSIERNEMVDRGKSCCKVRAGLRCLYLEQKGDATPALMLNCNSLPASDMVTQPKSPAQWRFAIHCPIWWVFSVQGFGWQHDNTMGEKSSRAEFSHTASRNKINYNFSSHFKSAIPSTTAL